MRQQYYTADRVAVVYMANKRATDAAAAAAAAATCPQFAVHTSDS